MRRMKAGQLYSFFFLYFVLACELNYLLQTFINFPWVTDSIHIELNPENDIRGLLSFHWGLCDMTNTTYLYIVSAN